MRPYVQRLEEALCEVVQRTSVASAVEYLKEFGHIIDGVILDLMIPPGEEGGNVADDLMAYGGKAVLCYIQQNQPGIPVLVLTNVRAAEALKDIPTSESIRVLHKLEHTPSDLVAIAAEMFGMGGKQS